MRHEEVTSHGGPGSARRLVAMWEGGTASVALGGDSPIMIGRSPECDLVVEHPSVSRMHARVDVHSAYSIEDLDSTNGCRVRGARIPAGIPAVFRAGDLVEVGGAVLVVQPGANAHPREARPSRPRAHDEGPFDAPAARRSHHAGLAGTPVVVEDPRMRALDQLVRTVAQADISVLLLGETGAGKEVFAERIHRLSRRASEPFLRINCAALTDTLLESELFGHARGAFTGAVSAKKGLLEAAHGGTLLLDEVGDLPAATQAKLLRVLECGEVLRVGEISPRVVDVRILAATNRDLLALVGAGRFRTDFYFRLNGITLTIPPLRERRAEIVPLAEMFLMLASRRAGRTTPSFTPAALGILGEHTWPGNVRELRNVVERALLVAGHRDIDAPHVLVETAGPSSGGDRATPLWDPGPPISTQLRAARTPVTLPPPPPAELASEADAEPSSGSVTKRAAALRDEIETLERRRIAQALSESQGNQSRAAELLGISRRTLTNRLNAFDLPRPRKGRPPKG